MEAEHDRCSRARVCCLLSAVHAPLRGMEYPAAQQIERGSAVHVAFEQLEPRDLPLDLPL